MDRPLDILMVAPQPFFRARGTPESVLHRTRGLQSLGHRVDLLTYPFGELNGLVVLIAEAPGVAPPRLRIPYTPVHLASSVCDRTSRAVGLPPPHYPQGVEFSWKDRAFDIPRARTVLGYEPQVDLEEGLRRTGEWYREEGLL